MVETVSRAPYVALVVVVLIAASAGGVYLYERERVAPLAATPMVVEGDNVTVNYIGIFGTGPDAGKVFDTSIYSVAQNNVTYPKALQYHPRGGPSNYTPLQVHVGASTPSGGYTQGSYAFIQVVPGFWEGLLGLPGNQTRTVSVPPDLGYGPLNTSCLSTRPLTYTLPVLVTLPVASFTTAYPGEPTAIGTTFPDPHYLWPVQVLSSNDSFVTIENLPPVGFTSSPGGWPVTVTGVTGSANGSGTITLVNELTAADSGHILGHDFAGSGPCSANSHGEFIVWTVDPTNGTYVANYNSEVAGETLIFVVTVVDIFAPVTAPAA